MPELSQIELFALLAVARLGDQAYGIAIRDEIGAVRERTVSIAAVYAALDRLDRQKLLRTWLSDPLPERGGRARRHYRLTTTGKELIRRERDAALRLWRRVSFEDEGGRS